jgi:hypothetical protein
MENGGLQAGFKPCQHPRTLGGQGGEGRTPSNKGSTVNTARRPDKPECEVVTHGCEELSGGCVDTIEDHAVSRLPGDPEKESGRSHTERERPAQVGIGEGVHHILHRAV